MAVMNEGEIEQIGTPKETYEEPPAHAADFRVANLLPATVSTSGRVLVNGSEHAADTAGVTGDCTVLIRPERVLLSPLGTGQPEAVPPLARVLMPDIEQHGYRAYPLVDHIADKFAAMLERYGRRLLPAERHSRPDQLGVS
jgi:ABC-type Fe3+/spermidine/putrescine transport system ATPase subunit